MNHFGYIGGELHAEQVPLTDLARHVGTPFYCYASATLERHYEVFSEAVSGLDALICVSLKANGNLAVVRTLARLGAGADVVSEGELRLALAAGIPGQKIVFSGVGKTARELSLGLEHGIYQFNVESAPELEALNRLAEARGTRAPLALRINPDVDAASHDKISTGRRGDKFGVPLEEARDLYARAGNLPGLEVVGVDLHIGSQLTDLAPLEAAFGRAAGLVRQLRADGHDIRRLDLGGGLGIPYREDETGPPPPKAYGDMARRAVGDLGCRVIFEPGRLISGNAGVLVSRVIYIKRAADRTFVILDAAMNDLLRPSLYEAYHRILPVREPAADAALAPVDVVGPICETGDTLARDRKLPPLAAGDLVAICSAGAYGAVMASTYNARPLAPEVLVRGGDYKVVRERTGYDRMFNRDLMPDWLED